MHPHLVVLALLSACSSQSPSPLSQEAAPSPEPTSAPAMHPDAAQDAGSVAPPAAEPAEAAKSRGPVEGEVAGNAGWGGERAKDEDSRAARARPRDRAEPALDWGGTVYLSNDDSMSLASAQRVLWAAKNRQRLGIGEIRPHELLNYFSFDAVTPDSEQVFDVLASAEQHGDRLSLALAITGATPPRLPLDLTLVVDRSGSMIEEGRMEYVRRGLTLLTQNLRRGDRVDLVLFDTRVDVALEGHVVGSSDPRELLGAIERITPSGGTDLGLGLRTGYTVAKRHPDTRGRNRRMIVLTDAQLNTGDIEPATVTEIGRAYDADGIRLTGVGVGHGFNDEVLDLLTEKGKGAYVYLGSDAVVDRVFGPDGFDQLTRTIAHDVHFALDLPPSLAMERFYGEESSDVAAEVQPVNYQAGTTQLFLQDLVLRDGRPVRSDPIELRLDWKDPVTGAAASRTFRTTVGTVLDADAHNVRKGLALMAWTDLLTADAMGADPCAEPLHTYAGRAAQVADDAEIAFVNGLVRGRCGAFDLPAVVSNRGVPFKVRIDADIPIRQVALACGGKQSTESLSGSDAIAMFTVDPGVCELTLTGRVDMTAQVEVPVTGGDLRCVVRGGRVACS